MENYLLSYPVIKIEGTDEIYERALLKRARQESTTN